MGYTSCMCDTIFKCKISICILSCGCYIFFYKNICIWIITKTWFYNFSFKSNVWVIFISFTIFCGILITNDINVRFLLKYLKINYQCHLINLQLDQTTVTAFCKKSKVISPDFFNDKEYCSIILINSAKKNYLLL